MSWQRQMSATERRSVAGAADSSWTDRRRWRDRPSSSSIFPCMFLPHHQPMFSSIRRSIFHLHVFAPEAVVVISQTVHANIFLLAAETKPMPHSTERSEILLKLESASCYQQQQQTQAGSITPKPDVL